MKIAPLVVAALSLSAAGAGPANAAPSKPAPTTFVTAEGLLLKVHSCHRRCLPDDRGRWHRHDYRCRRSPCRPEPFMRLEMGEDLNNDVSEDKDIQSNSNKTKSKKRKKTKEN